MPADAKGKFTIEQRREQVAQLYLAGANQTAIAKQLGIRKVINQTGASYGIQD